MSRNPFENNGHGYYYNSPLNGHMLITRLEYQARPMQPIPFVRYDHNGNHGDSIRCNSCYLGHSHSAASHNDQIAEYVARKADFAARQPQAYATWEAAQNDPNWD